MKNFIFLSLMICSFQLTAHADDQDLRSSPDFVKTCPEEFLIYIDHSEGGPGAYCACPDENIDYLDRAEGGPGFYCRSSQEPK